MDPNQEQYYSFSINKIEYLDCRVDMLSGAVPGNIGSTQNNNRRHSQYYKHIIFGGRFPETIMNDSVVELLLLSKKIGGPDYTNIPLYKESKYGINKQKTHYYQTMASDPVFCDTVAWMKESIDKNCILKSNDILNYTNLINSNNKYIDFSQIDTFMETSSKFEKDIHFKSMQDLKLELEGFDNLATAEQNQYESLSNEECILENMLKELEIELNSVEKSIININRQLEESSFKCFTSKDDFHTSIKEYLSNLCNYENKENFATSEDTTADVFNPSLFNFYRFFTELFSYDLESDYEGIFTHIAELLLRTKEFVYTGFPLSPSIMPSMTKSDPLSTIKTVFNTISNHLDLNKSIANFSDDYSRLHFDIEMIYLNIHVYDNSKKYISQYNNLSKETYFGIIKNNSSTDIINSISVLKEQVKKIYLEISATCKNMHEEYFTTISYVDCVEGLLRHIEPSLRIMDTNIELFYSYIFSTHLLSTLIHYNHSESNRFLKDLNLFSSLSAQLLSRETLSNANKQSYESFKTTCIFKLLCLFCQLNYDKFFISASQNHIIEALDKYVKESSQSLSIFEKTRENFYEKISDIEEVFFELLYKATAQSLENPTLVSFIPRDILLNKLEVEERIEVIQSHFEEFLSDYEWKKKLYYDDEARKHKITKMASRIPNNFNYSLS